MKTSTLIVSVIAAVLAVVALDFEKTFLATLSLVLGIGIVLALAVLRWRLDVRAVSPEREKLAHEHVARMRRIGA